MVKTAKNLKKSKKSKKEGKIGGLSTLKQFGQSLEGQYSKMKTQISKKLRYTISNNPITIYLKYHKYCEGLIMKHGPRCMSLIKDYNFGKLIFSILDYYCGINVNIQTSIDKILSYYVHEYMTKLHPKLMQTRVVMNVPVIYTRNEEKNLINSLIQFLGTYHNKPIDKHYEYYYLIYSPELNINYINSNIKRIETELLTPQSDTNANANST